MRFRRRVLARTACRVLGRARIATITKRADPMAVGTDQHAFFDFLIELLVLQSRHRRDVVFLITNVIKFKHTQVLGRNLQMTLGTFAAGHLGGIPSSPSTTEIPGAVARAAIVAVLGLVELGRVRRRAILAGAVHLCRGGKKIAQEMNAFLCVENG